MSKIVAQTLQDANVLKAVVQKYQSQLLDGGFPQEEIDHFNELIEEVSGKGTTATQFKETKKEKTSAQNKALAKGLKALQNVKDSAKSAFVKNKERQAEFHVGVKQPTTVSALLIELKYIRQIAGNYKDDMKKRGITDAYLTKFDAIVTGLSDADVTQEQFKKEQKTATRSREEALLELQELMEGIRVTACVIFEENEAVLLEFGAITIRKPRKAKPKIPKIKNDDDNRTTPAPPPEPPLG